MSDENTTLLPKISFDNFRKYPGTAILILVCVALGYLFNEFVLGNKDDCKEQIKYLQQQIVSKDEKLYDLQNELLRTNGIIRDLPQKIDSLTNETVLPKAKKIIKDNK